MKCILLLTSIICIHISPVFADPQSTEQELAELKAQLKVLTEKVNTLEQRLQAQSNNEQTQNTSASENAQSVHQNHKRTVIQFSGDFRGRMEYIDQKQQPTRQRSRIRLRLGAEATINDQTSLHLRLATGGNNPTSTNLTLDGGFSRKDIGLDRAYIQHAFSSHYLLLGKTKNPYMRVGGHGILFDSDLNPEGLAVNFSHHQWQAVIGGFYLDERKNDNDIMLLGTQIGFNQLLNNSRLQLGLGFYDYQNLQGALSIYQNQRLGNRFNTDNRLINDFNIGEVFTQYESDHFSRPLSVYFTYLKNTAADDENEAFMAGFKYGKAKQPHDWQLAYSYQYTEADAVYGLFNDSDFAGGHTDARGHTYQFAYGLNKGMSIGFTWIDAVTGMHLGSASDYDRIMLDLSYWFK